MNLVIDVNAVLYYVMQHDKDIEIILLNSDSLIAPLLYISETGNALLQYTRKSIITENMALKYFNASIDVVDDFIDTSNDKELIFTLAARHSLSYYDAEYLHLALSSNYKLLTYDKKLRDVADKLMIGI